MIIHRLQSRNLLKYAALRLDELPAVGLIGISGDNESGKSSIGETLCFALFGRTFAIPASDRQKLIRWGESRATVEVEFSVGDGARYAIQRFIDDQGSEGARLYHPGSDDSIAQGERVEAAVSELIGYDYDTFIESFYLAQREITSPHAHSRAVRQIAGLAPFEQVRASLQTAEAEATALQQRLQRDRDETKQQQQALGANESRYQALQQQAADGADLGHDLELAIGGLEQAEPHYREQGRDFHRAITQRRGRLFWSLLLLLLAALSGGLGYGMAQQPQHPLTRQVLTQLDQLSTAWRHYAPQLPLIGAGTALLALLVMFGGVSAWLRQRRADRQLRQLLPQLQPLFNNQLINRSEQLHSAAEPLGCVTDQPLPPPDSALPQPPFTAIDLERYGVAADTLREAIAARLALLRCHAAALLPLHHALSTAEVQAASALAESARLQQLIDELDQRLAQEQQRQQVRSMAFALLDGVSRHLSARFNHNIRGAASRILPRFTEGRYQHVRIDNTLSVQVFASGKGDFIELDEVSSGTQRQIMLALRIALAQELLDRGQKQPQFLFLDEPFAFFDLPRTRSALAALPELSTDLPQIWVTTQAFPEQSHFDLEIACRHDLDLLRS